MANYIYYKHIGEPLSKRFDGVDDTLKGLLPWKKLIGLFETSSNGKDIINELNALRNELKEKLGYDLPPFYPFIQRKITPQEDILNTLLFILRNYVSPIKNRCPRLFISHRQIDLPYALRIAQLAQMKKFEFWLDVFDPLLNYVTYNMSPGIIRSLLTACIIEMALINCTHVIACMTPNSRGTLWQPYEYGRITLVPRNSQRAAAWLHPHLAMKDFPKYMLLGEITYKEAEIEKWLENERTLFTRCDLIEVPFFDGKYDIPVLPEEREIMIQGENTILLSEWLERFRKDTNH